MRTAKIVLICMILLIAASTAHCAASRNVSPQWWGKPPGQKPVVRGEVANVSPTNIAVQTPQGLKPFTVDEKTKVRVRGEQATISDVQVGDPVVVKFRLVTDNVPLAVGVLVPKPHVKGRIAAIEGNVIVLRGRDSEHRVVVTDQTRYVSRGYQGTIADLVIGYGAAAAGTVQGDELIADAIHFRPETAKGTVVATDGDLITVKTVKQLTIDCLGSPATAVLIRPRVAPNQKGTLADIQVGMPVNIGFHRNAEGPCPLLWIDVLTGA